MSSHDSIQVTLDADIVASLQEWHTTDFSRLVNRLLRDYLIDKQYHTYLSTDIGMSFPRKTSNPDAWERHLLDCIPAAG